MKYFPFVDEEYRPQLGLKPLLLSEWLEFGPDRDRQMDLKRQILRNHRDDAYQVMKSAHWACEELREVVEDHLRTFVPGFTPYAVSGDPLEAVSMWTQEDWALLSPTAPIRLEAACICFPSRWSLKEKIGRDFGALHGPVPEYASIAKPALSFMERIVTERPVWRLNWSIHDSAELFTPGPHPPRTDLTLSNVIDKTYLRLERQTLRRLPATGFVAFSIRTYLHPLREVVQDPARAQLLEASLTKLPPETAKYKSMGHFHGLLVQALHSS